MNFSQTRFWFFLGTLFRFCTLNSFFITSPSGRVIEFVTAICLLQQSSDFLRFCWCSVRLVCNLAGGTGYWICRCHLPASTKFWFSQVLLVLCSAFVPWSGFYIVLFGQLLNALISFRITEQANEGANSTTRPAFIFQIQKVVCLTCSEIQTQTRKAMQNIKFKVWVKITHN